MRKILSILASIGLTTTAATAVVACGNKANSEVDQKTDLSSVSAIKALESKLTIPGSVGMTKDDAYTSFSNISGVEAALKSVGLEKADFTLELTAPTYEKDGSLKITVNKEESKYSGSLSVKISRFTKTALDSVGGLTKTIPGSANMNEKNVLETFLTAGGNSVLRDEVQIKAGTFKAPKTGEAGSFTLEALSGNHKYSGLIDITISNYGKSLESVVGEENRTIDGSKGMNAAAALAAFLAIPANDALKNEVQIKAGDGNFTTPENDLNSTAGKLVIEAKTTSNNYFGELTITIKGYALALDSVGGLTKTIPGSANMNEKNVLETFLTAGGNSVLRDEVQIKEGTFEGATTEKEGSFTISAKVESTKYTGDLEITISKSTVETPAEPANPGGQNKERVSSINDDHQTTVITLSTENALRLGYIKQDGDKFVAGDKLPNGPLTTKVGESTITAIFTPNFENGTVEVLLTIDTPSVNALSTNDDHKTTVITLSTADALRLGYIKQDGDKFVAGDKLPNGPLTTKVGESTITATFTPNFENGTVQVLLTIDTPTNN